MRKNSQQYQQFLNQFGSLLATQLGHEQPLQQRQAVTNLAEYVSSARRYHKLTRTVLAQKTGKTEVEIYALEHGLLPTTELDLPFLSKLATALDEELETLVLLLGQPAFVQSARATSTRQPPGNRLTKHRMGAPGQTTTSSKHFDNWFAALAEANPLRKGSANLIDSRQAGRLISHRPFSKRSGYRGSSMMVMLGCLLLICVTTYSLSGRFDAQSGAQAYATLSLQRDKPSNTEAPSRSLVDSMTVITLELPSQRPSSITKAAAYPDDEPSATVSLLTLPLLDESPPCDSRTQGRFALCRV